MRDAKKFFLFFVGAVGLNGFRPQNARALSISLGTIKTNCTNSYSTHLIH